jgi:hypothetical protein
MKRILPIALALLLFTVACDKNNSGTGGGGRSSRINPDVGATTEGFIVTNNETSSYSNLTITLNPNGSNGGYSAEYGSLAPGATITVPFSKFTDKTGRRFNIEGMKITQVRASAVSNGEQATNTFDFREH